jgi:hypothetical protein
MKIYSGHRYARMLKQNVDYRLSFPTKEKKRKCAVCRKQTEVCCFCFLFAANKQKWMFSVISIFHLHIRIY